METVSLTEKQIELLTHTLGAGDHIPKRSRGYRNRFCAEIGGEHHNEMLEMEKHGYVKAGYIINDGRDQYFFATVAGCQAIGLGKAAIKRAMEP